MISYYVLFIACTLLPLLLMLVSFGGQMIIGNGTTMRTKGHHLWTDY